MTNFQLYKTNNQGLEKFYEAVIKNENTYAPVASFDLFAYQKVNKLNDCNPDSPIKKTVSIKPLIFPQTSEISKFKEDISGIKFLQLKPDPLQEKKVILGVKLCDSRAFTVIDKVQQWDYIDEDYLKRRENTVLISTLCAKAENTCFCTSLDYDIETEHGSDILVVKTENDIYLKAFSDKGQTILENYKTELQKVDDSAYEVVKQQFGHFKSTFIQKMNYAEVNSNMAQSFESQEFGEASKNCLSCNACAFVCPTCHCFKITDEKIRDISARYKSYDSCNSKYFTLMAGGHNPRSVKYRRWRQRAMHKFVYYKERFGVNLCVGCGKCSVACPVDISIFDVVNQVAYKTEVKV